MAQSVEKDLSDRTTFRIFRIASLVGLWLCLLPLGLFLLAFGAWLPEAGRVMHVACLLLLLTATATFFASRLPYLPLIAGIVYLATRLIWSSHLVKMPAPVGGQYLFPTDAVAFAGIAAMFVLFSLLERRSKPLYKSN
jgi:hypothetical protein